MYTFGVIYKYEEMYIGETIMDEDSIEWLSEQCVEWNERYNEDEEENVIVTIIEEE